METVALRPQNVEAAAADDVDIISTLASDANPNPGAAKRATKSPKRDKAALRFHE